MPRLRIVKRESFHSPSLPPPTDLPDVPPMTLNNLLSSSSIQLDPALFDDDDLHVEDDVDAIALIVACLHAPPSSPAISSPLTSSATLPSDSQLVNDTNRVGPGHDIMVRPFVCAFPACKKAFARKSDLARHFRIHTNERPFQCLHRGCGKSFIQRSALTVHIRTHTGERPHVCEACEKTFADSSSLARHRRIHTGKRPYVCKAPDCGRSFARKITHGKHYRSAHPDQPPLSHDMSKPSIPSPLYTADRLAAGPIVQPGPPDASGIPQYWITTPADGAPHAYADSTPSEGSAYHPGGKRYRPKGKGGVKSKPKPKRSGRSASAALMHTQSGFGVGYDHVSGFEQDHSQGLDVSSGPNGRGRETKPHVSPAETEPTTSIGTPLSCSSAPSELHEIHSVYSACASAHTPEPLYEVGGGHDKHVSSSDFTWSSDTGHTSATSQGLEPGSGPGTTQPSSFVATVSTPTPLPVIPESGASPLDLGPSQHAVGLGLLSPDAYSGTYVPNAFADYSQPQHRLGPNYTKSSSGQAGQLRAASNPEASRQTSTSYADGLGGGFSVSQVSMPAGWLQPIDTRNDRSVSAPMSREPSRDGSPELVDVTSVPSFSFQPPAGPAVHMPFSAVDGFTNPLTHAPPQLYANTNVPPAAQAGRLHSAPPHLQRFNSLPSVPTISTWDISPASATSSTFGPTPDLSHVEDSWLHLEPHAVQPPPPQQQQQQRQHPQTQQLPQHSHQVDLPLLSPAVPSPAIATPGTSALLTTEPLRTPMWSSPIAFPNPPHPHIIQRNPFAPSPQYPSPTVCPPPVYTGSGNIGPGAYHLAHSHAHVGPPQFNHYTPQLQRYIPAQIGYGPSPITPNPMWQTYRTHSQPVSTLGSPVVLSAASHHFPHNRVISSSTDDSEHHVLLTTPPRQVSNTSAHSASVNTVGLGISNVHFDEDRALPVPLHLPLPLPVDEDGHEHEHEHEEANDEAYGEGEPELDSLDEYIVDDSDDEFVPGKSRKSKKKGSATKHKKRGSIKAIIPVKGGGGGGGGWSGEGRGENVNM